MKSTFPTYKLNDLSQSIMYGHTASAIKECSGVKFLRITDIQKGAVNWDSVPYCECSNKVIEKYSLQKGDIVFARTGATTGKSYLIKSSPEKTIFASYLIRVRPNDKVDPKFLARFFETPNYWNQIQANSRGATLPGVNATKLKELKRILKILEAKNISKWILLEDSGIKKEYININSIVSIDTQLYLPSYSTICYTIVITLNTKRRMYIHLKTFKKDVNLLK